jgi:EVE domain-containing protein
MPDDWRQIKVLTQAATFRRRPSIKTGDKIVYYAAGWGLVFAAGTVTSHPYYDPEDQPWAWKVDVDVEMYRTFIHEGVALDGLSVDGRELTRSMRRRSHLRLSEAEYREAIRLLS